MAETEQKTQGASAGAAEVSLLDDILAETKLKPTDDGYNVARRGVTAFIVEMLAPGREIERVDKSIVDAMIAELDARMSAQVNEILHQAAFQKLESAWRGLRLMIERVDFRENIRVQLLNVSKDELLQDFENEPDLPTPASTTSPTSGSTASMAESRTARSVPTSSSGLGRRT